MTRLRTHPNTPRGVLAASFLLLVALLVLAFMVEAAFAAEAVGDEVPTDNTGTDLDISLWALIAGAIVPLGTYALNYLAPWTGQPTKAMFGVALAAAAGALSELVELGTVGFTTATLEYVVVAVLSALVTHATLWHPSGIAHNFGGGRDRNPA